MKQLDVSTVAFAVLAVLSLQQVVGRSGIAGGFAMTSWIPIVLGVIAISVMLRALQNGLAYCHPELPPFWAALHGYATFGVGALFYVASTHIADPAFGWWLAAGLITQSLWCFTVYAALNARGISDRSIVRIQDLMVIAALSGIAAGIAWSLHASMPVKTELLAAIFAAAAFFDWWLAREPKRTRSADAAPGAGRHG